MSCISPSDAASSSKMNWKNCLHLLLKQRKNNKKLSIVHSQLSIHIRGCGGIGRLGGARCCYLSEGFLGGITMKWREMPTLHKLLAILGIGCALAYVVLEMLALCDILEIHEAISRICFGLSWFCSATLHKNKGIAFFYYLLASIWILSGLMRIFIE